MMHYFQNQHIQGIGNGIAYIYVDMGGVVAATQNTHGDKSFMGKRLQNPKKLLSIRFECEFRMRWSVY